MHTSDALEQLLSYALHKDLLETVDVPYVRNVLLDVLRNEPDVPIPSWEDLPTPPDSASPLLDSLCDGAVQQGLFSDTPSDRERFSARLMGCVTPSPEAFRRRFHDIETSRGPKAACAWFFSFCLACRYINAEAIARDQHFLAPSPYGTLEITINRSKPEKDPLEIAALANALPSTEYPACMLCLENEGYAGRPGFPARYNLRTLPVTLDGERWRFQYSPYRYFPEHCIVLSEQHTPMRVDRSTFVKLFDFLNRFPHLCIGSNADLPIVGGSILTHNHFQGGCHRFPMDSAPVRSTVRMSGYPHVAVELLHWPMTTLRLRSSRYEDIIDLAEHLRTTWAHYSDESFHIKAWTGTTPHNAITPIARRDGDAWVLSLVLRNNCTSQDHPLGLFHPHAELHHIKRENIGLIELMGLFILPGRLQDELTELRHILTGGKPFTPYPEDNPMAKHNDWITELIQQHGIHLSDAEQVIRDALAQKCARVLEDAGVFKQDIYGQKGLMRFLDRAGRF